MSSIAVAPTVAIPLGTHSLFRRFFRDDDSLCIPWNHQNGQYSRFSFLRRILRDAVQAHRRLIKRVTNLERLGGLVINGPLVFSLQHIPEDWAGVSVGRTRLTW